MRGLSENFIRALEEDGLLNPLLERVKNDSTLCLEIRKNYINIYYRGGNIIRIKENKSYLAFFDEKYCKSKKIGKINTPKIIKDLPNKLISKSSINCWMEAIPSLKDAMDLWFGKNPKNERESQQLVVRENNLGRYARSTDYFICDIEYANANGRFDLIAVRWPSSGPGRKNNKNVGIAFIEMKYYDGALTEKAGLNEHLKDMNYFLSDQKRLVDLKQEMKNVFNQMRRIGLINNQKDIDQFNNDKPEYIFILANHDPVSSVLKKELDKLSVNYPDLKLKFAASNFMGYGLYKENVVNLREFKERYARQIYSKE